MWKKSNPIGNDRNAAAIGLPGHIRARGPKWLYVPVTSVVFAQISFYRSVFYSCSVHVFAILDCNSLLFTIQFPDTLTPEVQQCSLLSSCYFAMSVWFAWALFFCTFSVEACEFVTSEVPAFENATRMLGSRFALSVKKTIASARHPCLHMSVLLHLRLSLPRHQPHLHLRSHCRSVKPCDDPQNEESGSVAKTTSFTGYEPNVIDNFDYSDT